MQPDVLREDYGQGIVKRDTPGSASLVVLQRREAPRPVDELDLDLDVQRLAEEIDVAEAGRDQLALPQPARRTEVSERAQPRRQIPGTAAT